MNLFGSREFSRLLFGATSPGTPRVTGIRRQSAAADSPARITGIRRQSAAADSPARITGIRRQIVYSQTAAGALFPSTFRGVWTQGIGGGTP